MRGRLNRVLFYSFSYVRRASQYSDQWHGCSFIVAQYSTSNPSECRLKAVPTASGHLQFTGLSDASRNKNSGEKTRCLQIWISCLSLAHKHASHFFLQSRLWPERRLIHTKIQTKAPQEMQKKATNCCLSIFSPAANLIFLKRGNILQALRWLSGRPTLSCFGPVYQPQCVPPTPISSSSPLHTSRGGETSPNTSPTHMLRAI